MILFGASGHSKVVLDILISKGLEVSVIVDDDPKNIEIFGVKVRKTFDLDLNDSAIISIGNNLTRKIISEKYPLNYISAIHSNAVISQFSRLGIGTVVMANATINPDVIVGKHCIINTGAVVEHDCIIGDFVHVSPNASLAGNVSVGEGSHIGIGASVIQGVNIGRWATLGAGTVVIKNVPDFATVVGNPGKIIKIKDLEI